MLGKSTDYTPVTNPDSQNRLNFTGPENIKISKLAKKPWVLALTLSETLSAKAPTAHILHNRGPG